MTKLQALKCIELTSQTQANNGTICYHDPIAKCEYLSYENGYIRRAYTRSHVTPRGYKYKNRSIYQLNPQKLTPFVSSFDGQIYYTTERIMVPTHEERMERLARAVVNFRTHLKKQKPVVQYNY